MHPRSFPSSDRGGFASTCPPRDVHFEGGETVAVDSLHTYCYEAIDTIGHSVDDSLLLNTCAVAAPAVPKRTSKHKTTFLACCAEYCDQTFFRKDHLTQHFRNKHQKSDTKFYCPVGGCANHCFNLHELFEHMKQAGHQRDVHFSSIKNATEKPKCPCGDGLVVFGVCKACHASMI